MKAVLIPLLLLLTNCIFGQQQFVQKIATQICDSLANMDEPLQDLTKWESRGIVKAVINKNYFEWVITLNEYKANTGKRDYTFDQYCQHVFQTECKAYRAIYNKLDTYLETEPNLRPLYFKAREFVLGLEDNLNNEMLSTFL